MGGLTIVVPDPTAPLVTVRRGLWLTADRSQVVERDDPRAAFALGRQISISEAQRLGLLPASEKALDHPADKALKKPADKSGR